MVMLSFLCASAEAIETAMDRTFQWLRPHSDGLTRCVLVGRCFPRPSSQRGFRVIQVLAQETLCERRPLGAEKN
jgi:hypothetical protein